MFAASLLGQSLFALTQFLLARQVPFYYVATRVIAPAVVLDTLLAAPMYVATRWWLRGEGVAACTRGGLGRRVRRDGPIRTGRKDRPIIQLPSVALRAAVVVGVTVVLVGVILFRLWFLQILSGHVYVREANDNRLRPVKVVAPRGAILDRNGKVLVDNRAGLAIGIRPMDVPHGQLAGVIGRLAQGPAHVVARGARDSWTCTRATRTTWPSSRRT